MKQAWPVVVSLGCLVGCGAGEVESGTISLGINSMNPSDIEGGVIRKDENISTESGNPWGEFVKLAREECAADPTAFEVTTVTIELDEDGSDNVGGLEDVVSGEATVYFQTTQGSDDEGPSVDVASVAAPTGAAPVPLDVVATSDDLTALHTRLLGGDFHVGLRAATTLDDEDDFSLDVRVVLAATASCD